MAKASGPDWRRAFCVRMSSGGRIMWFASAHEPKPLGAIDMQACADVCKLDGGVLDTPSIELRTVLSLRVQLRAAMNLDEWHHKLNEGIESYRREAEAKRLIRMSLQAFNPKRPEDGSDAEAAQDRRSALSPANRLSKGWSSARRLSQKLVSLNRGSASSQALLRSSEGMMPTSDQPEAVDERPLFTFVEPVPRPPSCATRFCQWLHSMGGQKRSSESPEANLLPEDGAAAVYSAAV